jgi:signal peptidase I
MHSLKSILTLICIIIFIIIIRVYFLGLYKIPSSSMSPTLKIGDRIIVCKMIYGPRVLNVWNLINKKRIKYHWYNGFIKPNKEDIFVFNWPDYKSLNDEFSNIYGSFLVKRCLSTGNDTVSIKKEERNVRENMELTNGTINYFNNNSYLFPFDSILPWTINNYGPLWVPGKGKTVKLTSKIASHYSDVLLYEGYKSEFRNDSVFLNGIFSEQYCFKEDYYFMLGDNFYSSLDSRYWGFVPRKNIIGKAILVLFSLDPEELWYKRIRWRRFMKKIK